MTNAMEDLRTRTRELVDLAGPMLDDTVKIAAQLDPGDKAGWQATLMRSKDNLGHDRFKVMFFGRFKAGKSTLLNALLARLPNWPVPAHGEPILDGPMPVGADPVTVRPTRLYYSDEVEVIACHKTPPHKRQWTLSEYLDRAKKTPDRVETASLFEDIEGFEVGIPAALCRMGVEFIDSPGTDDNDDMDFITFQNLRDADAAILLTQHPGAFGQQELQYICSARDLGLTSYLTVINGFGRRGPATPASEHTKAELWNRYLHEFQGLPPYSGQNLESTNVYFLDALQAFEARVRGNRDEEERSGIIAFERGLARYLETERRHVHVKRHLDGARSALPGMRNYLNEQIRAAQQDLTVLEKEFAAIKPQLDGIQKRRDTIPKIIDSKRSDCLITLEHGLDDLYDKIITTLPEFMASQTLPSLTGSKWEVLWEGIKSNVNQNKLCEESVSLAAKYITERVRDWTQDPPKSGEWWKDSGWSDRSATILRPHLEALQAEVVEEADTIERTYGDIQFRLTGWTPPSVQLEGQRASLASRVTAGSFGLLTGQIDQVVLGGMGGWKMIFRDLVGRLAVGLPLIFVFHASAIVALPLAVLGGISWSLLRGTRDVNKRINDQVVNVLLNGHQGDPKKNIKPFLGLWQETKRLHPELESAVKQFFEELKERVMKEVDQEIAERETSLTSQRRMIELDAGERTQHISNYEKLLQELNYCESVLDQAETSSAQLTSV